jgi:hypothetical protein
MKRERAKRLYEASAQDLLDLAGEDPLGFELLRTQLAEAYAADGLDEEDCIYQMAKCLFLKRDLPTKRTRMKSFTEAETLDKFNDLLLANASESEIQSALDSFRGELIEQLRKHYPRRNYDSTEAWIEALKRATDRILRTRVLLNCALRSKNSVCSAPRGSLPDPPILANEFVAAW